MNRTLSLLSPAKLNLFLHVTGRRSDGYHTLQTVFQLLNWGDTLHFTPNRSGRIELDDCNLHIPPGENLVLRAAELLRKDDLGVRIGLEKRIPVGGGLGGGSSNAATTLLALNVLWDLGLENRALRELGAGLGADVPVFTGGHSAWAEGVGEVLTPVDLPLDWYLVITPQCHVSTAEIFFPRAIDTEHLSHQNSGLFRGALPERLPGSR